MPHQKYPSQLFNMLKNTKIPFATIHYAKKNKKKNTFVTMLKCKKKIKNAEFFFFCSKTMANFPKECAKSLFKH